MQDQEVMTSPTPEATSTAQRIDQRSDRYRGCPSLIASTLLIVFLWTVVFPWLSTLSPFAQHIERMEQADIVVDAMFYTELNWEAPDGAAWRK